MRMKARSNFLKSSRTEAKTEIGATRGQHSDLKKNQSKYEPSKQWLLSELYFASLPIFRHTSDTLGDAFLRYTEIIVEI